MRKPTLAEVQAARVILAAYEADDTAPAKTARKKTTRKPARKAPKPTKGSQTRETLSRKDWNRTLTCKAKLAGGGTYKAVLAGWDQVTEARDAGMTPDEALALFA